MFDKTKEKVASVMAIPDQIKWTMTLAFAALIVGFIALAMSASGVRRAN